MSSVVRVVGSCAGVCALVGLFGFASACSSSDSASSSGAGAANGGSAGTATGGASSGGAGGSSGGKANGAAGAGGAPGAAGAPACHAQPVANPKVPAPTALNADEIALVAAVVGACVPDDGTDRNAAHLWSPEVATARFYYRFALQAHCLAQANCGCDAIAQCAGFDEREDAECKPGCAGTISTECGDGLRQDLDCGAFGLTCQDGKCVDGAFSACDDAMFTPSCDSDGRPVFCANGATLHGPDCAALGLVCDRGSCVGSGDACPNVSHGEAGDVISDGISCSGDMLQACVNGKTAELDCSLQGASFSCQTANGVHFCGLASECVPADDYSPSATNPVTCDGSKVVFCNAGRLEHVDCAALGFTGCEVDPSQAHYGCIPGLGG